MNCKEAKGYLHGYMDGELDLVRSLAIETHLQSCPDCGQEYRNLQLLRGAMRAASLNYTPTDRLRQKLEAEISRRDGNRFSWVRFPQFKLPPNARRWQSVGFTTAIACVCLLLGFIVRQGRPAASESLLSQEVIACHVRSLMVNHLADVASSNQHTVKPWFSGKLDFAPPVVDLASDGFPLKGGRLEYVAERPAAALVYARQKHTINLLIWPDKAESSRELHPETRQGFHLVHWAQGGMTFWAISDLNSAELQDFAAKIQRATP